MDAASQQRIADLAGKLRAYSTSGMALDVRIDHRTARDLARLIDGRLPAGGTDAERVLAEARAFHERADQLLVRVRGEKRRTWWLLALVFICVAANLAVLAGAGMSARAQMDLTGAGVAHGG